MNRGFALLASIAALAAAVAAHAQDALTLDMVRRLQVAHPQLQIRPEADDRIGIYEKGQRTSVLDLGNLRALCETRPDECERQKANRIALVNDMGRAGAFDRSVVRAVVRPAEYMQAVRRQLEQMKLGRGPAELEKIDRSLPLSVPLGRHFVRLWVRDSETGMAPLGRGELEEQKLGPPELDKLSAANFEAEPMPTLVRSRRYSFLWEAQGSDYLPSVLVDSRLWKRVAGERAGEEAWVCFPERDALVAYFPRLDARREVDIRQLCDALATRGVTFSPEPVRRINDNWELR